MTTLPAGISPQFQGKMKSVTGRMNSLQVLLLDLPAPTLQPQEKLLIDLSNTPSLIRTSNKSCTGAQVNRPARIPASENVSGRSPLLFPQLIDLSSPLIKWSPENKSENTAPLINLSF